MQSRLGLLALVLLCGQATEAKAVTLGAIYIAEEEKTYWEPISRGDVERVIEQTALEVLTRAGLLRLNKVSLKDLPTAKGDYLLRIAGRMVGESETHTIQLGFEARDKAEIGSFRTAGTVTIGKIPLDDMRKRIESSTRIAAEQLVALLKPAFGRVGPTVEVDTGTKTGSTDLNPDAMLHAPQATQWNWGDITIPEPPKAEVESLFGKDAKAREGTLRLLMSEALTTPVRRNGLELCATKHPAEEVRLKCLIALRPSSRRLVPTQQVVIEIFRRDKDSKIVQEASEQMEYFTGMSRSSAIQAWLERTGNEGRTYGPIAGMGDLPNLDTTIARCLASASKPDKSYERSRGGCIELMEPLDLKRRRALIWPYVKEGNKNSKIYLNGAGRNEGSNGTEWQWAFESILKVSCKLDDDLETVLWNRYLRDLSSASIDAIAEYGPADQQTIDRLVQSIQTGGERAGTRGLRRLYSNNPELRPLIKNRIAELDATGNYDKNVDVPNMLREFEQTDKQSAK
ncbi:MAG: hypothetical protein H7Z43_12545 [Clostridia bacterium]|nr:hypothetical protein [Deltaproteobacteria bacterium]